MIALLLMLASCAPSDDEASGCVFVAEFAYEAGIEAGESCHTGDPNFLCLATESTGDPEAWENGCTECAYEQYEMGLADSWSCDTP